MTVCPLGEQVGGAGRVAARAMSAVTAQSELPDGPRKSMNLFTAINDGMRVAMETDDTAVSSVWRL